MDDSSLEVLEELLQKGAFIAHNALFELKVCDALGLNVPHDPHCTMLLSYLLEPWEKHNSLEECCDRHKSPVKKMEKPKSWDVWDDYMAEYCAVDSDACWHLFSILSQRLQKEHPKTWQLYLDIERPYQRCLHLFNNTGLLVDQSKLEEIGAQLEEDMLNLYQDMTEITGLIPGDAVTYSRQVQLDGDMCYDWSDLKLNKGNRPQSHNYVKVRENKVTDSWRFKEWKFL